MAAAAEERQMVARAQYQCHVIPIGVSDDITLCDHQESFAPALELSPLADLTVRPYVGTIS